MKKPVAEVVEVWHPPVYDLADAKALKQLEDGTADADQQKRALRWIVMQACGTYEMSYRPGSDRDSTFAEGRRFVGLQIVKMLKLNLSLFKDGPTEQP